jgi:hypothetical protein
MINTNRTCQARRRIANTRLLCSPRLLGGIKFPSPEAGAHLPRPEAGGRYPSPEAGAHLPRPEAGGRYPSPEAGGKVPSPEATCLPIVGDEARLAVAA